MATGEFRLLETLNDVKQLEMMSSLEDRRLCGAVTPACMIRGISRQGVPCFSLFLLYCLSLAALGFSSLLRRLSAVVESRGCSLVALRRPLWLQSTASRRSGFSSCGSPALEHGLGCSAAYGIFRGQSLALAGRFFTPEPPGRPVPQFCPLGQHVTCLSMTGHPGEIRTLSPKGLETILGPLGKSCILVQESRHGPTSSGDLDLIFSL